MTIRTSLFVFSVLTATAWFVVFSVADAAPLNPVPSTEVVAQTAANGQLSTGEVIVDNGCVQQEYVESAGGFGFLSDNYITRAYHSISKDFKRNNCWPRPFVWNDRQAVRAPFAIMVNKGWQRENTLGEYHFEQATGKLNEPGRRRVHWIINQHNVSRRSVFVHRAMQPEMTLARVDSVQQWVAQLSPHGELPPVIETNLPAPSRPAEEVDRIRIDYLKSMPSPRLPMSENFGGDGGDTSQ
ncbi:MAG: hypothetical protein U9N87_04260 [Planctomycetota bacterium]|nr:hypothetical protein [Planctomycetota bacterium]